MLLILTSCCDRPCGTLAWNRYLAQEEIIKKEMDILVPQYVPPVLSSIVEPQAYIIRVPYKDRIPVSPYRIARDARERRLLRVKRKFHHDQLMLALDECGCLYNREVEQQARASR